MLTGQAPYRPSGDGLVTQGEQLDLAHRSLWDEGLFRMEGARVIGMGKMRGLV
jgi:hypothetical protein